MQAQYTNEKLIEIFCICDDVSQAFSQWLGENHPDKFPTFKGGLCPGEIAAILIAYHLSGYKCFEYYYKSMVLNELKSYFPGVPSYKHFLSYITKMTDYMFAIQLYMNSKALHSGIYYVDSKKLPVCDNRRIHNHRVFQAFAQRGKSSTGWFYGLKIHLVINHLGEPVSTILTSANVADNNPQLLTALLKHLKGLCFGDKGYLTRLFEIFYENGLQIITKCRKNMSNKPILMKHKLLLNKRGMIESVNDILMTVCNIDHSRHRNPLNAISHIFAGISAYSFLDNKPALILNALQQINPKA